jgi:hypothetical protein
MGISVKVGLSLGVSQVRSEDKMAADLQMAALLFYQQVFLFVAQYTHMYTSRNIHTLFRLLDEVN